MDMRILQTVWLLCAAALISACGGQSTSTEAAPAVPTQLSVATALFAEKALSANGQMACASCHTDENAHADGTGTLLPLGGLSMMVQGFRSSPTLLYLEANTAFRFEGGQPVGGFTWDGRASSRAEQAAGCQRKIRTG